MAICQSLGRMSRFSGANAESLATCSRVGIGQGNTDRGHSLETDPSLAGQTASIRAVRRSA